MIKKIIYNTLFRHEKFMLEYYKKNNDKLFDKVRNLKNQTDDYKSFQDMINRILYLGHEIIGIEENKDHEKIIVTKLQDEDAIDIYLYSTIYMRTTPKLLTTIYQNYTNMKKYMTIEDVQMINNSKGNGSIAMKYLIKYAKQSRIDFIGGTLSSVDKENWIRSVPYYKKFGFEVNFNSKKTCGKIKLNF